MNTFNSVSEAIEFLYKNVTLEKAPADFPDAAQYLSRSQSDLALEPLMYVLSHGGGYMRATAALGLGYLHNQAAIPALIHAFSEDPETYVRCDAALALGELKAEEVIPVFLTRFIQENFEVQKRILMATRKISTENSRIALDKMRTLIHTLDRSVGEKDFLLKVIDGKKI